MVILCRVCEDEFEATSETDEIGSCNYSYSCDYNYTHSSNYFSESQQLVKKDAFDVEMGKNVENCYKEESFQSIQKKNKEQYDPEEPEKSIKEEPEKLEREHSKEFLKGYVKKQMQEDLENEAELQQILGKEKFIELMRAWNEQRNQGNDVRQTTGTDILSAMVEDNNNDMKEKDNTNREDSHYPNSNEQEEEIAAILSGESELLREHNVMGFVIDP